MIIIFLYIVNQPINSIFIAVSDGHMCTYILTVSASLLYTQNDHDLIISFLFA